MHLAFAPSRSLPDLPPLVVDEKWCLADFLPLVPPQHLANSRAVSTQASFKLCWTIHVKDSSLLAFPIPPGISGAPGPHSTPLLPSHHPGQTRRPPGWQQQEWCLVWGLTSPSLCCQELEMHEVKKRQGEKILASAHGSLLVEARGEEERSRL